MYLRGCTIHFAKGPKVSEVSKHIYAGKHHWSLMQGFQSVYKPQRGGSVQFAELLDAVASVDPEMRIRFTSPHPKDFSDDVLKVSTLLPAMLQLHMSNSCQAAISVKRCYTVQTWLLLSSTSVMYTFCILMHSCRICLHLTCAS